MAKVRYEVTAVTGKYTNAQGEEKKRYLKCGVILEGDKGLSLKLEALPVAHDGWFYLFEPKAKEQGSPTAKASADPNDDIGF
jgi:hypothetical protein